MNEDPLASIRPKIAKYCAYRERATKEVLVKLESLGVNSAQSDQIIDELKKEGFIDDRRFARAYAGGKFRTKKWGKLKIKRELKMRDIGEEDILSGLQEIEGQTYLEVLEQLAKQKYMVVKNDNLYIRKNKVASFLVSKGYESELVWAILNKIN